jgi:formylglycine-generating enzyme required for sulfatase activity
VQTCAATGASLGAPVPCTVANGTPACNAGACTVASCNAGFCNPDGLGSTGCEVKLGSSDACGTTCSTAVSCGTSQACGGTTCTTPPSCQGLASNCGPTGAESCCTTLTVPGGTFYRVNDGVTSNIKNYPATLSTFRLDKYDVTVGRFRKFLKAYKQNLIAEGAGKNPNNASDPGWSSTWNASLPADTATLTGTDFLACDGQTQTWTTDPGANEDKPVNCVSWYEAAAFCIWDGGRLPTETEWNYASSGGSEQRLYAWSSPPTSSTIDCSYANYQVANGTYCVPPSGATQNVGMAPKGYGKFGQADLAGNVWQWTYDWFADALPQPCTDCANLTAGTSRVIRGGDYGYVSDGLASIARAQLDPVGRGPVIGVRCARAE